jgi:hypothetical protein
VRRKHAVTIFYNLLHNSATPDESSLMHIKYATAGLGYNHARQADQHQSLSASVLWQSQGGGPKLDLSSQAIGDRCCPAQSEGGTGCAPIKSGATAGVHQMRTGRSAFGVF